jgi:hypothetical protein
MSAEARRRSQPMPCPSAAARDRAPRRRGGRKAQARSRGDESALPCASGRERLSAGLVQQVIDNRHAGLIARASPPRLP